MQNLGGGKLGALWEMWKWRISPFLREVFFQLLQFSHLVKGRLKFQLDLGQRTNTSHVFTLLGVSSVKGSVTVTCKTDTFYIVMLNGLCASRRRCLLQSCALSVSSLINNRYTFRHPKSKIITKFTGLGNVDLPSNSLFVSVCSVKNTSC